MQRAWAFLHLILLFTSAQGSQGTATEQNTTNPVTSPENTTAGVTNSTTGMGTADPTSVSYNLTETTGVKGSMNDTSTKGSGVLQLILSSLEKTDVIVAFGIGIVLTALVWTLTTLCRRGKRKSSVSVSDTLEMVSARAPTQSGQHNEWTQTHGGAEEAGETAGSPEVEYSDIDFSALKRQRAAEDGIRENTESEYAEIKRDEMEEREEEANEEVDTVTCEQDVADEEQLLWTEDADK